MLYLAIALVLITLIVSRAVYISEKDQRDFSRETREWKDNVALSAELEAGLKDLKDLKAQVDSLKLRSQLGGR